MKHFSVTDIHQSFWQLASLQIATKGLIGFALGGRLANEYGMAKAIGAICISNLILWLISIVIVSMTRQNRLNSVENVRNYLGIGSAMLAAISFLLVFLFWFIFQLDFSLQVIDKIFPEKSGIETYLVRIGAALGVGASLIAIGGIRVIKWVSIICIPVLICFFIYAIFASSHIKIEGDYFAFSISPIIAIVLFNLSGILALPNFFRHSRSIPDSFFALTLIAVLNIFFQVASTWIKFDSYNEIIKNTDFIWQILFALVIVLIVICNLTYNIYVSASSCEAIYPKFEGPKEYAIIGLTGTVIYLFLQITPPIEFVVNLMTDFISNLCIVFLIIFIVQIVVKRRAKSFGKLFGSAAFLVGCVSAIILSIQKPYNNEVNSLLSMGISALFFLSVIFAEETIWSMKKLFASKSDNI